MFADTCCGGIPRTLCIQFVQTGDSSTVQTTAFMGHNCGCDCQDGHSSNCAHFEYSKLCCDVRCCFLLGQRQEQHRMEQGNIPGGMAQLSRPPCESGLDK